MGVQLRLEWQWARVVRVLELLIACGGVGLFIGVLSRGPVWFRLFGFIAGLPAAVGAAVLFFYFVPVRHIALDNDTALIRVGFPFRHEDVVRTPSGRPVIGLFPGSEYVGFSVPVHDRWPFDGRLLQLMLPADVASRAAAEIVARLEDSAAASQ